MLNTKEKIKLASYEKMPKEYKQTGIGRFCGKTGYISKKYYCVSEKMYYYTVILDGHKTPLPFMLTEDAFENSNTIPYVFEVILEDNLSIVRMKDTSNNIIAENHGHIFGGNSPVRVAQATSYALKRLFESLDVEKKYFRKKKYFSKKKTVARTTAK